MRRLGRLEIAERLLNQAVAVMGAVVGGIASERPFGRLQGVVETLEQPEREGDFTVIRRRQGIDPAGGLEMFERRSGIGVPEGQREVVVRFVVIGLELEASAERGDRRLVVADVVLDGPEQRQREVLLVERDQVLVGRDRLIVAAQPGEGVGQPAQRLGRAGSAR